MVDTFAISSKSKYVDGLPDMGRVWELDVNELTSESKPFARGAFGKVYKGEYFGTPVCIKAIRKEDPNDSDYFKFIQREVSMLKFGHPNLVQFMGVIEKEEELHIVTEYISGGHLRQYLKDDRVFLPWALRVQIATDVACGMAYLHSKGIIHRDLKSKNLLVGDNWRVKGNLYHSLTSLSYSFGFLTFVRLHPHPPFPLSFCFSISPPSPTLNMNKSLSHSDII